MKKSVSRGTTLLLSTLGILSACSDSTVGYPVQAGSLTLEVTPRGTIGSFVDRDSGRDYFPSTSPAPILTLRVGGEDRVPVSASLAETEEVLILAYPNGIEAHVAVVEKPTHATFELISVSDEPAVELAIWGPFPTAIRKVIGETVGVVRGESFAMGLQALNPKTLGGYPWNENDAMPQLDIFESGDYSDLSEEGKRHVLYRVEAAKPDTFGSTLQAYTRNRSQSRIIKNWGHERYLAPAFDDGGIVGSKIALFGCSVDEALSTIGAIEVAEGLPHPTIDGEWGKQAASAAAAYVILPFSESTIDRAVDVTLRAGLRYLYHPEPFETWGHFRLGEDFPNGIPGLRQAVQRAEEPGVHVGVHTLSNFITTNDPYVAPIPDPRLARVGTTALAGPVSVSDTEVPIESPGFFNQNGNNHLRAAALGQEIVRYREVSDDEPWRLVGVERGAFGTTASSHPMGDSIGKLADHAYRVFLTDPALGKEMAERLAGIFNETGLRQISFDGLEGNRSTGLGNYGEILFTTAWYDALSEEIRDHFIADASRTSHYFWHIYSRMNWGEPWYAGFRESQTEYRLKNQAYFRRNMMPGMLGWFRMQPETSLEDIEWMLARSAAFDAGYAFVTSFEALEQNGRTDEILDRIGMWEEARMAGAFSSEQKLRMEDIANEFRLEPRGAGGWDLVQVHSEIFRYEARERQPGEPRHQGFSFENSYQDQRLELILTAVGVPAKEISLELDGVEVIDQPFSLETGQSLVYEGGPAATLFSPHWQPTGELAMDESALEVEAGSNRFTVDADLGDGEGHLKVELRLPAAPEFIRKEDRGR